MGRLSGSLATIAILCVAYLQFQKYYATQRKRVKVSSFVFIFRIALKIIFAKVNVF